MFFLVCLWQNKICRQLHNIISFCHQTSSGSCCAWAVPGLNPISEATLLYCPIQITQPHILHHHNVPLKFWSYPEEYNSNLHCYGNVKLSSIPLILCTCGDSPAESQCSWTLTFEIWLFMIHTFIPLLHLSWLVLIRHDKTMQLAYRFLPLSSYCADHFQVSEVLSFVWSGWWLWCFMEWDFPSIT